MKFILKCTLLFGILSYPHTSASHKSFYDDYSSIKEEDEHTLVHPTVKLISSNADMPWQNDWEIVHLEKNQTNLISKHKNNLMLHLECTAPYKIVWIPSENEHLELDMTGLGMDNEARVCGSFPNLINGTNVFTRTLSIHFKPDLKFAVGEIQCLHQYRVYRGEKTNVGIFIPGEKALLHNGQNLTYNEFNDWIRCPSTDPRIPVSLFIEDAQTRALEKVNNILYNPAIGFHVSEKMTNGSTVFICSASDNSAVRFHSKKLQKSLAKAFLPVPEVQVKNFAPDKPWQNDWEIIKLENNETNIVAKHNNQPVLHLVCTAADEVIWLFDREFNEDLNEVIKCDNFPELRNGTKVYTRVLSIRFKSNVGAVANIICEHKTDTDNSQINVFIPGPAEKPLIHSGEIKTYTKGHRFIECPTSNPQIPVTLWAEDSQTGDIEQITNTTYDPAKGFRVEDKSGIYICSSGKNDKVRFVPLNPISRSDTEPKLRTQNLGSKDLTFVIRKKDILSRCGENKYNNVLIIQGEADNEEDNRSTIISSTGSQFWLGENIIDLKINSTYKQYNIVDIFCIRDGSYTNGSIRGKVLSKWSASTSDHNMSEKFNQTVESYYYNSQNESSCGTLSWEHFPVDEEVFMISDGDNIMYSNYTSNFTCKTRSRSANLTFWMEMADGTRTVLRNDPSNFVKLKVDERQFLSFKTWKLSLRLPVETVAVICEIPYKTHPTLYLSAERRFRTAYLNPPVIFNSPTKNSNLQLTVGEIHQKLVCECTGEPQPEYSWMKDDKNVKDIPDLNFRSTVDHFGNGILEFPSITKFHEGTYICNASNYIGSESYVFTVSAQANAGNQIKLISSISCFVFAVLLLGLAFHRYHKTKILVRNNVDQELNDLF